MLADSPGFGHTFPVGNNFMGHTGSGPLGIRLGCDSVLWRRRSWMTKRRGAKVMKKVVVTYASILGALMPASSQAHVKWFFPYDLSEPPLPIGEVITPAFIYMFLVSTACIYAFFWVDRYFFRTDFMVKQLGGLRINEDQAFWIMRGSASLVFLALFVFGMMGSSFYLTPELATDNPIVSWAHLAMAAFALFRPTVPLAGVGIFALYGMAMRDYGVFHLLDYLIFVGIAVYFFLSFRTGPTWTRSRYVTLFALAGLTLLWASIEKWGYPGWTYPLLRKDTSLLMGLTPEFYMLLAGFVEFNITFILLSSVSIASRFIALALNAVFILAIFKFGLIDAVGHLMIIAVLLILVARGPTNARYFLVLSDKSLWTEAYFMTGLYMLAFNVVFISYYGLYFLIQH